MAQLTHNIVQMKCQFFLISNLLQMLLPFLQRHILLKRLLFLISFANINENLINYKKKNKSINFGSTIKFNPSKFLFCKNFRPF